MYPMGNNNPAGNNNFTGSNDPAGNKSLMENNNPIKKDNLIGSIIAYNRKKNGMTQPMLSERLAEAGFDYSFKTISSWEKGLAEPSILTFAEICRILGIPDIYEALYDENPYNPFSRLNDEGKEKLNDYASLLIDSHKYDKHAAEVISIVPRRLKLYENRVSAGTGNFLDSDDYRWKEVGDDVSRDANFGLYISGDSMEPRYKDKSIVWVKQQSTLVNGNIGIFCLNGDAFCKKYREEEGKVFLVSLNEKYAPIQVHENDSFKIFGRVLN